LKFSTETEKYLPLVLSRWEGVECMNYSALIYANNEKNIAITGEGVLDGQANNENWWWWKGLKEYGWNDSLPNQKKSRDKLFKMNEENIPVDKRIMGKGEYLRPNFVQFYNCENILIRGVEFKDSPMWFINPVLCKNITIKGVKIEGLGPNNDGCNPESCENVLISDCFFNTGDDCIAIKSGRNNDGRRIGKPSENIIIKNCKMKEGHGGVVIGSEISGGVRNIFVENCEMDSPNLDRAIRIKTNSIRGGFVENLYARNIKIGVVKEAVLKINFYYEEGDSGEYTPSVKNIILENITSQKSDYALWIRAYERSKVAGLRIENCRFENVSNGSVLENVEVPIYKNYFVNCKLVE
jgi:polygalacturonase